MPSNGPLLTIGIPTYNRAHYLEAAIRGVIPQLESFPGEVELVVSDNCSTDDTQNIASRFANCVYFRYYRNQINLGMAANFALCAEKARGTFLWLIGDDDLVREDAVSRVLGVLRSRPYVDFVFINASTRPSEDRAKHGSGAAANHFPELSPAVSEDWSERDLEKWDELIDPDVNCVFLGSLMVCIIRRELWMKGSEGIDFSQPFGSSLSSVYPHSVIFAKTLVGRRAFYLGYPCLIAFWGHQEWKGYLPIISAFWLHRLLDLYAEKGVEMWRINKCRRRLLMDCGGAIIPITMNATLPGHDLFSVRDYVKKYWFYKELWIGTLIMPVLRRMRRLI